MSKAFDPPSLSVLALASNPALGRATQIMLSAMGFGRVEVCSAEEVCARADTFKPTFILFTPEYLSMPVAERMKCGCPCKPKIQCNRSLSVIFLKKKTVESILMSKDMGFNGIIFADQSMDRLYEALQTVYETKTTRQN